MMHMTCETYEKNVSYNGDVTKDYMEKVLKHL